MKLVLAIGVLGVTAMMLMVGGMSMQASQIASASPGDCDTPHPKGHYTVRQMSQLWVSVGGPQSQATIAGAVGMAESTGDPRAYNPSGATGLMQILGAVIPGDLFDPQLNMRNAVKKYEDANGWTPWVAYTSGAYRKYLEPGNVPAATCGVAGTPSQVGPPQGPWLAAVPGQPGESCDARIIPDVLAIVAAYHVRVTDCYAPTGHAPDGEHPLGLAVDLVPGPDGTWDDVDRLAAWAEPEQDHPRSPFRWVGYNGDPNHGRGNHLHLSWLSSGFRGPPAENVTVINQPGSSV